MSYAFSGVEQDYVVNFRIIFLILRDMASFVTKYQSKIIDVADELIVLEALKCADNDCLRAGYIMVWISIVESLKRKLYLLNATGSTLSTIAVAAVENLETDKKSTDIEIVKQSLICGILSSEQHTTLEYLWTRRCLYAHPYETSPTAVDLTHALEQGLAITLGVELHYHRKTIDEKIAALVLHPHIVANNRGEIKNYVSSLINRIKESDYLHAYIAVQKQYKQLFPIVPGEFDIWIFRRLRIFIINLVSKDSVDLSELKWGFGRSVEEYCFDTWALVVDASNWDKIPDQMKEQLVRFISEETIRKDGLSILKTVVAIFKTLDESDTNYKHLEEFLMILPFKTAVSYLPSKLLCARAVGYLKSSNYHVQNVVLDHLTSTNGEKFLDSLANEDRFSIGQLILKCKTDGNWKAQAIFQKIGTEEHPFGFNDVVIMGILHGCFFDQNNDFKTNSGTRAFPFAALKYIHSTKKIYEMFDLISSNFNDLRLEDICFQANNLKGFAMHDIQDASIPNEVQKQIFDLQKKIIAQTAKCEDPIF